MQLDSAQGLRRSAQDVDVAYPPRRDNGFPYPNPGDPEPVFVNAVFLVIAEPRNRGILELLRVAPMTEMELRAFVDLPEADAGAVLHDLIATGLVRVTERKHSVCYVLDRSGFSRITDWMAPFKLWGEEPDPS